MLKVNFLKKGLGLVSPPHLAYDFLRKIFLILYPITRSNFVVWLPLLLEILGNMCIAIICFPIYDVMNFEINLSFLIKSIFHTTVKVSTKNRISQEEKEF